MDIPRSEAREQFIAGLWLHRVWREAPGGRMVSAVHFGRVSGCLACRDQGVAGA